MKQFERALDTLIIIAIVTVATSFYIYHRSAVARLKNDVNRLSVELAHAQIPMQRDTIRDSVEVVTQTVVEVVPRKIKEALAADEQLIKDLRLKVKQLEAMQTTVIETSDTVPARYQERDSIYNCNDQWADISLDLKDTTFRYNIRDSLSTLVYREYRHHFLWWQWGTKGYRLKIANFNPHAHVTYNKYVKAER